jgi:hypothetical protein
LIGGWVCLAVAVAASCLDEREARFEALDADVGEGTGGGTDGGEAGGETPCSDHGDCAEDELCFEDICVDREEALADCRESDDCPEGFVCIDEDHCEEE